MRPDRIVFVAGTHTEVGKTWWGAQLLSRWRTSGWSVAARKPVQSFDPADPGPADAECLAAASGEDPATVCPPDGSLSVPMAPPMAAAVLGRRAPTIAELADRCVWPAGLHIGLVEGVGAVRSPVGADGDNRDLIEAVAPDVVVLVADAALGTIGAVRSNCDSLGERWRPVVALNRYDPGDDLHRRNAAWLRDRDGLTVHLDPADAADRLAR